MPHDDGDMEQFCFRNVKGELLVKGAFYEIQQGPRNGFYVEIDERKCYLIEHGLRDPDYDLTTIPIHSNCTLTDYNAFKKDGSQVPIFCSQGGKHFFYTAHSKQYILLGDD